MRSKSDEQKPRQKLREKCINYPESLEEEKKTKDLKECLDIDDDSDNHDDELKTKRTKVFHSAKLRFWARLYNQLWNESG